MIQTDYEFLPGVPSGLVMKRLNAAGGNEVSSGKLSSPESSAALAVNTFGWFMDRPELLPVFPMLHFLIGPQAWLRSSTVPDSHGLEASIHGSTPGLRPLRPSSVWSPRGSNPIVIERTRHSRMHTIALFGMIRWFLMSLLEISFAPGLSSSSSWMQCNWESTPLV
jgi:hypothetical protein